MISSGVAVTAINVGIRRIPIILVYSIAGRWWWSLEKYFTTGEPPEWVLRFLSSNQQLLNASSWRFLDVERARWVVLWVLDAWRDVSHTRRQSSKSWTVAEQEMMWMLNGCTSLAAVNNNNFNVDVKGRIIQPIN